MISLWNGRKLKQESAIMNPAQIMINSPIHILCLCFLIGCSTQHSVIANAEEANANWQQRKSASPIFAVSGTVQLDRISLTCGPNSMITKMEIMRCV